METTQALGSRSENEKLPPFCVSVTATPSQSGQDPVKFVAKIVDQLDHSVISERLASRFPSDLIDRNDNTIIQLGLRPITSAGKIQLTFRIGRAAESEAWLHILPTEVIKTGFTMRLGGQQPPDICDAMIMNMGFIVPGKALRKRGAPSQTWKVSKQLGALSRKSKSVRRK